ncbi:hypothetical protein FQN51_008314 [Onygenales sp. PD_10]|nr:hypothetical protein FQN51_008314 [Onygenales sp. PD_10]
MLQTTVLKGVFAALLAVSTHAKAIPRGMKNGTDYKPNGGSYPAEPSYYTGESNPTGDDATSHLSVSLDRGSAGSVRYDPVEMSFSVHNSHKYRPITFLKWNTPFDESAAYLGIFTVYDVDHDRNLDYPMTKTNRKFPPSYSDVVEVPAGGWVSGHITLPPTDLNDATELHATAEGYWYAAWYGHASDASGYDKAHSGETSKGHYKSNTLVIEREPEEYYDGHEKGKHCKGRCDDMNDDMNDDMKDDMKDDMNDDMNDDYDDDRDDDYNDDDDDDHDDDYPSSNGTRV